METNDSHQFDYSVFSSIDSSTIFTSKDENTNRSAFWAPVLLTLISMTAVTPIKSIDISAVSQPVTVCQSMDITVTLNKEDIFKQFVSKLVLESKEIDPEIAEIVNKNYRKLLW